MRLRLCWAACAAAALAACSVTTEGAQCGDRSDCPSGQGCGADGRCSVRALTCAPCKVGLRCVAGGLATCAALADGVCTSLGEPTAPGPHQVCDESSGSGQLVCVPSPCTGQSEACSADRTAILSCLQDTAGAGGCFYAADPRPCAGGLVCAAQGTAGVACACPDAAGTFVADPVNGSADGASPPPTGAADPPACRFRTLSSALSAATARVQAAAGATATVRTAGFGGGAPVVFAESLPELRPGVTLTGADRPDPLAQPPFTPYILELARPLVLHDGATLSALTVRPGADALVAVTSACDAGATQPATVQDVAVLGLQGTNRVAVGVQQAVGCPLAVLHTSFDGATVAVRGAGGALTVAACRISGAAGSGAPGRHGIVLDGSGGGPSVAATLQDTSVTGTADTALLVNQLGPSATLSAIGNTFTANCGATPYLVQGGTRRAGGVAFVGALPAADFRGNAVYGNGYDQILVANSAGALRLVGDAAAAGGQCPNPASANQIACLDAVHGGYGIYSGGAAVAATGNFWGTVPPNQPFDYDAGVDPVGTDGLQVCGLAPLAAGCVPLNCP